MYVHAPHQLGLLVSNHSKYNSHHRTHTKLIVNESTIHYTQIIGSLPLYGHHIAVRSTTFITVLVSIHIPSTIYWCSTRLTIVLKQSSVQPIERNYRYIGFSSTQCVFRNENKSGMWCAQSTKESSSAIFFEEYIIRYNQFNSSQDVLSRQQMYPKQDV